MAPMLPPDGRHWQLISPHFFAIDLNLICVQRRKVAKHRTPVRINFNPG